MQIESEGGARILDPAPAQVESVLRGLRVPGNSFAILERAPMYYMQTAKNDDGSFLIEYQEGSLDEHYDASGPRPLEDVIESFISYLSDDDRWRSKVRWRRADW